MKFVSQYEHMPNQGLMPSKITKLGNKIWKKRMYWDINRIYEGFPIITGFPDFIVEKTRPYFKKSRTGQITPGLIYAPKKCYLGKIVNYDYERFGAPMKKIVAAKGEGKSNLLTFLTALDLAKGVRILTFNDARLEVRSLAPHGYFDTQGQFKPFQIDIFRPKGYEYKRNETPLWDYYPNVHDCEFETTDDIIHSMAPGKVTVVYEDCFTRDGRLRLLNELVEQLVEEFSKEKIYTFVHHEVARLIPENPTKDIYKLIHRWADNFSNFRKDKIGFTGCFHDSSYSFYQTIQRIGVLFQKAPVDKKRYSPIEKEARGYSRSDFAIKRSRGWMKHTIGMYPELPDEFRLVAQRRKLLYPSLEYEQDEEVHEVDEEKEKRKKQQLMHQMRYEDDATLTAIGEHFSMPPSTVSYNLKKYSDYLKNLRRITTA